MNTDTDFTLVVQDWIFSRSPAEMTLLIMGGIPKDKVESLAEEICKEMAVQTARDPDIPYSPQEIYESMTPEFRHKLYEDLVETIKREIEKIAKGE